MTSAMRGEADVARHWPIGRKLTLSGPCMVYLERILNQRDFRSDTDKSQRAKKDYRAFPSQRGSTKPFSEKCVDTIPRFCCLLWVVVSKSVAIIVLVLGECMTCTIYENSLDRRALGLISIKDFKT